MRNGHRYGHSEKRAFDAFDTRTPADRARSKNPAEFLHAGRAAILQSPDWETRVTGSFEIIAARI
ncbi:MAG: hypothetical protein AAGC92_07115 [Pseudomonadota bacterium]